MGIENEAAKKPVQLKKMFKELNEDPETLFLAETGLEDYLEQIKNHENAARS